MNTEAFYLYCFTRGDFSALPTPPASLLRESGLTAVLAQVERREFCGPEAEARMADSGWLAGKVAEHCAAVDWAMRFAPVFPARFGTLFSSHESVALWMRQHADAIAQTLERVDGKEEWAVKLWCDRKAAAQRLAAEQQGCEADAASAGRRYLQQKQRALDSARQLDLQLRQQEAQIYARLLHYADERRPRPCPSPAAGDEQLTANWALLAHQRHGEAFVDLVIDLNHELEGQGLRLELTGPWPPYSFCTLHLGDGP